MILSSAAIVDAMSENKIHIEDFHTSRLNPNSYNLRLGNTFITYEQPTLDQKKQNRFSTLHRDDDQGLFMTPGRLYLAETKEYTETHQLVPKIDGRSSIGRLGVCVHVTAGFGDIGFCGKWTLELVAVHPIMIYPGTEICQISYHEVSGDIFQTYQGKYQNNHEVQPSLLFRDFGV